MIEALFASGHVADLVLIVMAIEAATLFALTRFGIITLPFRAYLFGIIAGGLIILALRQALVGGPAIMIAVTLGLSFVAHIAELFSFVQRKIGNPNPASPSYTSRSDRGTTSKKGL
jgi:hypothetical protein